MVYGRGGILSPILFTVYIDELMQQLLIQLILKQNQRIYLVCQLLPVELWNKYPMVNLVSSCFFSMKFLVKAKGTK